jgi:hypothetical protein
LLFLIICFKISNPKTNNNMSSSIETVVQTVSMKESAINAVQQLLVENVAPATTVSSDSPSGAGKEKKPRAPKKVKDAVVDSAVTDSAKPEKKPRAPKKVKDAVVDGATVVTDGVAVTDSAKPEKKPRAPKKVKPTVDAVVDSATVVTDGVAVTESIKPEKKPRAPKKVKPTVDAVVDGATVVTDGVAVTESVKPEKKPRAPKKVKPTVDAVVDGATVVTDGVAVTESVKPEKKPRAPKKVKSTVEPVVVEPVVVEPVVVESVVVEPVVVEPVVVENKSTDSVKPEKKTRSPKKTNTSVESKINNDTDIILQFIEKMSESNVIDKDTYKKLQDALLPNKSTITETDVVVKKVVSADQIADDVELEEGEEIEEELVTTEFVHQGVLYLKDSDDNLYSRNPPHEFVLNLLE